VKYFSRHSPLFVFTVVPCGHCCFHEITLACKEVVRCERRRARPRARIDGRGFEHSLDNTCMTPVHMCPTIHVLIINHKLSSGSRHLISSCIVNILSSKQVMRIAKIMNYVILSWYNSAFLELCHSSRGTRDSQWGDLIFWARWRVNPHYWQISNFSLHLKNRQARQVMNKGWKFLKKLWCCVGGGNWRRANARNVSFITRYGGQFTFST